jgi:DNA replication initiation complex subunit (GINS family)
MKPNTDSAPSHKQTHKHSGDELSTVDDTFMLNLEEKIDELQQDHQNAEKKRPFSEEDDLSLFLSHESDSGSDDDSEAMLLDEPKE